VTAGIHPPNAQHVEEGTAAAWWLGARLAGWRGVWLLAALFFAVHLAFLAPTLDDIDAVNFALGVRSFDPAQHRPHPPGYPVYIVLGKVSTALVDAVRPADRLSPISRDNAALALAFWSALFGAVSLLACYALFLQLEALSDRGGEPGRRDPPPGVKSRSVPIAACSALLAAVAPLSWFTSSRPMSDVPGLTAALVAQALLLDAWRLENLASGAEPRSLVRRSLELGALIAALALGIRSQVLWLTLPLLVAVVVARGRRLGVRAAIPGVFAYGAGIAAWALPMIAATGGLGRYLQALGGQGAEDFSGVDMLWTHFGFRRVLVGLWQTFVLPWSSAPLAIVVLLGAVGGLVVMLRRRRVPLAVLALLAGPYAVFHTLFHETVTTRYALPLVPAVCYLAVRGFAAAGRRASIGLVAIAVAWSLVVGLPAIQAYASSPSPFFRAIGALEDGAPAGNGRAVLGMHRRVSTEGRLALRWAGVSPWSQRLPSPRDNEWRQALAVLRDEPDRTIWFLGEPARGGELRVRDLALVDPRAQRVRHFDWGFGASGLLDGVRPATVDLYEIGSPGWIAGEGWSLTPETAGVAEKTRTGPSYRPIEVLVRRRPDETVLLIGGRHLGGASDGPGKVELAVDGRPAVDFVVDVEPQFFLRMLRLPAGTLAGTGPFARLTLRVRAVDLTPRSIPIAIEQFDLDGVDGLVYGFDTGWQEGEYDPARQRLWRWMSERATVLVHAGGGGPLMLRLTAESPRRYFDRPPQVSVHVGDKELARMTPEAGLPRLLARLTGGSSFSMSVSVDRDALARAGGRIALESDQFFVPAARAQNPDRRHLAMRVLGLTIEPRR
jgi:hypothetical protein